MRRIVMLIVLVLMFSIPSPALADIAPPAQPPGSNPQPGSTTTQVRMQAENVLIEVQASTPSKSLGQAHVTASFTMHNDGAQPETMAVRFPVSASDGFFNYPQIRDFQVKVNGKTAATQDITGEDPYGGNEPVPWKEFNAAFPAGQDTAIQVTYTLEAAGDYPFVWFKYVFSTGAGWKDSIGSADLTVRFPYAVNEQNVLFSSSPNYTMTSPGGQISGNEIHWHYADLEPTQADNFEIDLAAPAAWQDLLAKKALAEQNPNDGEAWGQLGKAYKQLTVSPRGKGFRLNGDLDPVAQELYQLSRQAYEKSVSLKPDDPLWHAGLADLLGYYAYFAKFSGVDTTDDALGALREIQLALKLAPQDAKVQEIAAEISGFFPDGMKQIGNTYDYPWLTATPVPPTTTMAIFTDTPVSETAVPSVPPSPAASPAPATPTGSGGSAPVCGGALLLPIGLMLLARRRIAR